MDYLKHFLLNNARIFGSFFVGAILVLNIASVTAEPVLIPPGGDIDAKFRSVAVGEGGINLLPPQTESPKAPAIDFNDPVRFESSSRIQNNEGLTFAKQNWDEYDQLGDADESYLESSAFLENLTGDEIYFKDNIVTREGGKIGSYVNVAVEKDMNDANGYSFGKRQGLTATCPQSTQIVGCTGRIRDLGNKFDADYQGAEFIFFSNSCKSFARRHADSPDTPHGRGVTPKHFTEALCFDPTGQLEGYF